MVLACVVVVRVVVGVVVYFFVSSPTRPRLPLTNKHQQAGQQKPSVNIKQTDIRRTVILDITPGMTGATSHEM
jgi:hypothetical protein